MLDVLPLNAVGRLDLAERAPHPEAIVETRVATIFLVRVSTETRPFGEPIIPTKPLTAKKVQSVCNAAAVSSPVN